MDNIRTDYDLQQGDRYRLLPKGDSTPTDPKWQEYDRQLKAQRKAKAGDTTTLKSGDTPPLPLPLEGRGAAAPERGLP